MDDALAVTPPPTGSGVPFDTRLARARSLFDVGKHGELLEVLPGLLADGHDALRSRSDRSHARLSACYSLASQVLVKIGRYERARLTADRATVYAGLSGSALVAAAAARELSIVLRHQAQAATAQRVILDAVAGIEATGLRNQAQAAAYAQMLCTTSYTAARAGDRGQAQAMIREAAQASRALPHQAAVRPHSCRGDAVRGRRALGARGRRSGAPSGPHAACGPVRHGRAQGPDAHRPRACMVAMGQARADRPGTPCGTSRITGRGPGPAGHPFDCRRSRRAVPPGQRCP